MRTGPARQPDAPKRVLLQFRVVANAIKFPKHASRERPAVGDRKLLALRAIEQRPGLGVNDLAHAMGIRQPTASQLVKALMASGLIEVQRDQGDRRAVHIRASARGRAMLRRMPAGGELGDRLPLALRHLDAGALSSLEQGLDELLRALPAQTTGPTIKAGHP